MDNTPIYDIKPYLPYADRIPDAVGGFAPDGGKAGIKGHFLDLHLNADRMRTVLKIFLNFSIFFSFYPFVFLFYFCGTCR